LEAFKAGEINLKGEREAVRWATGYQGDSLDKGEIVRAGIELDHKARLMTLVFNTRQARFRDPRIRRALSLAYDFEWTNKNLFHGLYQLPESYFGGGKLAARGRAKDAERKLLKANSKNLSEGLLEKSAPPSRGDYGNRREALKEAARLLDEAGYLMKGGRRVDPATGSPMEVRVVHGLPPLERMLGAFARDIDTLGITLKYQAMEPVSASKRMMGHDFDMTVITRWEPGPLPGMSESLLWGSALADRMPSYALGGVKDASLDAAIAAMAQARSMDDLEPAARAFDRLMRWQNYALPLWRSQDVWVAHWSDLKGPDAEGLVDPTFVDLWWRHEASPPAVAHSINR
jgi:ABC-type oligopeptide transport system substrate-binding subunit